MEAKKLSPSVSVCIPCIPIHMQYLEGCLTSILRQTTLPEEVVLVTSESNPFIKKYIKETLHPFKHLLNIRYKFFTEERSAAFNRNEAIKIATGDLIVSMDADDYMYPQKIDLIKEIFSKHPDTIGLFHYFLENTIPCSEDNPAKIVLDESLLEKYYFNQKIHFGHATFKRSLFNEFLYPEIPRIQDIKFVEQILPKYSDNLMIYKDNLTVYMSIRSASYSTYSKRFYDLLFNQHEKPLKKMPSVSVCIPCIPSHIEYLHDCLFSIVQQTVLPEEIIIVTSEATDIVKESVFSQINCFEGILPITCEFFTEKQFAGTNRNAAIKLACSDIIALIDADDMMYPERIEIIKSVFKQYPFAVGLLHYFTENSIIDEEKFSEQKCDLNTLQKNLIEPYYYSDKIHCGHASFRRSLFDEYQYTSKPRGQDIEFIENILPKYIENLLIYKAPLTFYMSDRSSFYHLDAPMVNKPLFFSSISFLVNRIDKNNRVLHLLKTSSEEKSDQENNFLKFKE